MKKFIFWLVIAVIIGAAIGGTFIGGITVGKNQKSSSNTSQLNQSQLPPNFGQNSTGTQATDTTGFPGRGTMGTVEKIDGNTITIKTMQGTEVTVTTDSGTTVEKTVDGSLDDITTGVNVQVTGTTQTDASINATNISVNPSDGFIGNPMQQLPMTTTTSAASN